MLVDPYGRIVTYLRVSVTDRCNFRCSYCMPADGVVWKPRSAILRYEEIERIARVAAALGISKIKITGGEPLLKRNIERLVGLLSAIDGIRDIGMSTNGSLLTAKKAVSLKSAGLCRVNVSLDTLDPWMFSRITRGGDIRRVLDGIQAACAAGLAPVKINMVIFENTTDSEVGAMRNFCENSGLVLQTIRRFSLHCRDTKDTGMETQRPPQCFRCDKLRLTADGMLKPCLFSDTEIPIDPDNIKQSLAAAAAAKPMRGRVCSNRIMNQIGG